MTLLETFKDIGWHLWFGICRLGSVAWDISFGVFRLETFGCDPSLENFRLEISLGSFRARPSALKHSLGNVGFGSFV